MSDTDEVTRLRATLAARDGECERLRVVLDELLTEAEDVFVCMADATGIDRHNLPEPFLNARAALTAPPAPSPWRPIETAPKDGTQFLTWDGHYGIRIGRCVVRPDHDDWLSYMDAHKGSSKGGIRATFWMPLPSPPQQKERT
ncbi:MAG TPA: hypothetical protein VK196_22290 [Magnetospirillum sp.]|nr:hypothetical protein [Magnetospirillum sp.]